MAKRFGKVYLVGAGPGDPGLLTLRGRELLDRAEVVVFDALVSRAVLELAPLPAERIDAGKRGARHRREQEEINRLLVLRARQGKTVVRLKGGDPFLFGRGGEEAEFLARHRVPFEIVPGVSSAVAAPAYAGIPLTDRRCNSMVTIVTGHGAEDRDGGPSVDWERISPSGTLVVLMGMGRLGEILDRLVRLGWPQGTPAACVRWGTTGKQRVLTGTLGDLSGRVRTARPKFGPPAVVVIGKVAKLARKIFWFDPKRARP